ncbi:limkain-b1-type NYN domain-containing protein, partial [Mycena galopus ATCC 62051]
GYEIVSGIRNVAHRFGPVKHFKAYMEVPDLDTFRSLSLRSELQSSGVSLTDCPHNGRKNVADQMIMVDMLAYAMDHPAPATLILISGDRDFAYAVSILRLRRYEVVVISLPLPGAHISLKSQASVYLDW